ncbi:hypothetical protein CYMTET_33965, partial [Cymbomonas tetramitiformis]
PFGCSVGLNGRYRNYVSVPRSSDFQFPGETELSIEMWIMPNKTTESHKSYGGTIVSKYNRGRMGQFFMHLEQSGDLFFHRETPPWGLRSSGVHIPPGVYTHVAVSYGGGRSKLYINGTLRGSQKEGPQAEDKETPLLIGAIHDNGQPVSTFHGAIDEVRIWGIDRTQMEIQSTMHTTLTGAEFGLKGYWTFDECASFQIRDAIGKHDGELHGGRWQHSAVTLYPVTDIQPSDSDHDETEERQSVMGCIERQSVMGCIERQSVMGCIERQSVMGCIERQPVMGCIERQPIMGCIEQSIV